MFHWPAKEFDSLLGEGQVGKSIMCPFHIDYFVKLLVLMDSNRIIQQARQGSYFCILIMPLRLLSWCCINTGLHAVRKV